jgi:hypothetical protein
MSDINSSIQDNQNLLSKLTDYMNAYTKYQTYLDTNANCFTDKTCPLYDVYNAAQLDYTTKRDLFKDIVYSTPSNMPDSSYNYIVSQFKSVANLKNAIEQQTQLLSTSQDGTFQDSKFNMDLTVYASLCWTILATSALYVIFVKL